MDQVEGRCQGAAIQCQQFDSLAVCRRYSSRTTRQAEHTANLSLEHSSGLFHALLQLPFTEHDQVTMSFTPYERISSFKFNSGCAVSLFISYISVSSFSGFKLAFSLLSCCFSNSLVLVLVALIFDMPSEFLQTEESLASAEDERGYCLDQYHLGKLMFSCYFCDSR
jgi:hypothetical protein